MNLFINAVSTSGILILFDDNRHIIAQQEINIKGNESSKFIDMLDDFLSHNNTEYNQIDNIVTVTGPGSFTGVRTIALMVNTIAFSHNCTLTSLSYFEMFSDYPIIKQSSKRDVFISPLSPSDSSPLVRGSDNQDIQIMSNDDAVRYLDEQDIDIVYGEASIEWGGKIVEKIEYPDIITHVKLQQNTRISPLYIKKPNIC